MLENTKYKLEKEKKLTCVFLGGSITEGAGATNPACCWASRFDDYLKERYADCDIRAVNVGIGGTGSDLGAYRCEKDVLSAKPDLVFYEFAVNDYWMAQSEIADCCEAILYKIRRALPCCDIIFLYTTTKTVCENLAQGNLYTSRSVHTATAYRYGNIMQIDVGEVIRTKILTEGGDFARYLPDTVHPNDLGHGVYFETIRNKFTEAIENAEKLSEPKPYALPALSKTDFSRITAHMKDSFDTECSGFEKINTSFFGKYPHYIEGKNPGDSVTFTFSGRKLDLFCERSKDSGTVIYKIDDLPEQSVSTWDEYCKDYNRPSIIPLTQWLPQGEHTVTLRISDEKAAESQGHAVRIAAFLIV